MPEEIGDLECIRILNWAFLEQQRALERIVYSLGILDESDPVKIHMFMHNGFRPVVVVGDYGYEEFISFEREGLIAVAERFKKEYESAHCRYAEK